FMELGLAFMPVNVNLSYSNPANLGDVLDIETVIDRIGEKSITLAQKINMRDSGELIVSGEVTFVVKDMQKGVAVPVKGRLLDMFLRDLDS
ncbi:MAG: acyl-CoA thioesterase, partial [Bacteroidota bacterium]